MPVLLFLLSFARAYGEQTSDFADQRKLFFQKLLDTAIDITTQVVFKGQGSEVSEGLKENFVELCHDLYNVLKIENREIHSVFLMGNKQEREKLIYNHLHGSTRDANLFLQEIFSELFHYYSDKLRGLHNYFYAQVKRLAKQEPMAAPDSSQDVNKDFYKELYLTSRSILSKMTYKSVSTKPYMVVENEIPAILCFLVLITKAGDLVFGCLDDDKSANKEILVAKTAILLKAVRDFTSEDIMVEFFEKLSEFMARLDEPQTDEEWNALAEELLNSSDEGIDFLDEFFACLHFYLEEKLAEAFEEIFFLMVDSIPAELVGVVGEELA